MKKIAVIFSNSPYGNSNGQDGLNIALSLSCYTNKINLFFIEDGIFQIYYEQNPKFIYFKNYSASFKILPLCNVNNFYVCYDSLKSRGLKNSMYFILDVKFLSIKQLVQKIHTCDCILNF